ncbi:uncharacterized protein LOC123534102 isoform X2 [Mercenaria mercenaria]|uniref:uncharacterized protein LOC123534102 isoform X2 n=1 Tax=Mercenaria mercenaria TaxID=6596 RepID=UPI00234E4649|nr:uncharacterized protein LOC123534102 isoform X2 [Mercenaria mercenaria]
MADSKALQDIGAPILKNIVEYKKCGMLDMERQGILAKLIRGRWCHRFLIVSKGSKENCSWCLFCYEDQFSKKAEAVYILRECKCVEDYTDIKNPDITGLSVRFTDAYRKDLVFACPSLESKEIWKNALQSGITESQNYSADSGFASGGSTRDLLIDPLANQYVTESIIRQSRYGYEDIDDADILMTESKSEKEMKQKHKPHRKTSVDENMKSLTDPYYINMKQSPIRMNDVHMALSGSEDSQPTSGSSQGFLSVRSPSTVPSLCSGTQETDQTEDEGNTCLKTIEESSDESSVESTTYENLKFLQDEYLQDNKEEMISQKWIAEQPIGTFIIRLGTTTKKGGKVYLSESRTFHTLDDLVNFYRFHDLPSRHIQQKLTRGYKSEK